MNGLFLTNDITITLNDQNNVFTVSPTTISKDNTGIDTPVAVNVTFNSDVEGDFTGSLTLTSNGAETKTVQLTAKATDKGMASDPYLDLAKYETIDEVGATVSGMSTIYTDAPEHKHTAARRSKGCSAARLLSIYKSLRVEIGENASSHGITAEETHQEGIGDDGRESIYSAKRLADRRGQRGDAPRPGQQFGKEKVREHRREHGGNEKQQRALHREKVSCGRDQQQEKYDQKKRGEKDFSHKDLYAIKKPRYELSR